MGIGPNLILPLILIHSPDPVHLIARQKFIPQQLFFNPDTFKCSSVYLENRITWTSDMKRFNAVLAFFCCPLFQPCFWNGDRNCQSWRFGKMFPRVTCLMATIPLMTFVRICGKRPGTSILRNSSGPSSGPSRNSVMGNSSLRLLCRTFFPRGNRSALCRKPGRYLIISG